MNKVITMLCAALATCVVFAEKPATEGAEVGKWTMDIPAAKALAKEVNKPIFINFTGSDWCGWCQLMDKKVFSQPEWQAYAKENLILLWIDFPKNKNLVPEAYMERNREFAKQYKVSGYPTYVLLAADGETELGQLSADAEATAQGFVNQVARELLISNLDQFLSPEDYAAWQALLQERKDFDEKVAKWQVKMRKESEAFQTAFQTMEKKREEILDKALEASKK
jgi:thioredoxin-related protein